MFEFFVQRRAPEYVRLAPQFCDWATELVRQTYMGWRKRGVAHLSPRGCKLISAR